LISSFKNIVSILSPSSVIWYWPERGDAVWLGR